jgi:hypothetical protein
MRLQHASEIASRNKVKLDRHADGVHEVQAPDVLGMLV